MKVLIHPWAAKALLKLSKTDRVRILAKIAELEYLNHPLDFERALRTPQNLMTETILMV